MNKLTSEQLAVLQDLYKKTGHTFMECRKALVITAWDLTAAEAWLASDAWKLGKLITYKRE